LYFFVLTIKQKSLRGRVAFAGISFLLDKGKKAA